jgi:hypothetical protein
MTTKQEALLVLLLGAALIFLAACALVIAY